jgi:tetratricopeptide (TPR) repeat protein
MKPRRFVAAFFVAVAVSALLAQPAWAKDKWINLTTRNFNIVSNADERDTRELAQKLEQFRFVFSQLFNIKAADTVPVTVMVFKSDGAFTPYKPLYNGKPQHIAGYFQPGKDENVIALNIAGNELRPMAVIFHEYTHLLTSFSVREWPAWLKEGMAELYSTFDVKKNEVTLGMPVSSHVFLLRENKLMPLAGLFSVDHKSPEYNEGKKQGIFYAQSWALVHYLMFGDKSVRQPQLVKFVDLLMSGVNADEAFREALKTDFASIEKELRRYVGNDKYNGIIYTLASAQVETEMAVRPLDDAEVQFYLGNLLFRTRRADEAEAYFKRAAELDPTLARPYEGLGFLAMERNRNAEAKEQFKKAIANGSKNHLAHYHYADVLRRDALERPGGGLSLNPEEVKTIVEELKTSIKLMPTFAYSYELLGFVRLVTGENLEEGAQMLKQAVRLEPQNKHFALSLAQIQVRMQDYASAKKILEPLLAAEDDSSVKAEAASMMKFIDSYTRPLGESSTRSETPPAAAESGDAPRLIRRGEESKSESTGPDDAATAGPTARPSVRIEGAEILGGVLAAIECGNGMILVFRTRDKLLRFTVGDVTTLQFYSQDPQFKGDIGCGPINLKAYVYFKALPGQTRFAGDAVGVELAK